ncbi:MAG: hypothetical protein EOO01_09580 [Chitinophagaceae bacterium]|nr:MAG: hypothetical protein EOO01_09580 [Chitinophagaceae bacterium]
MEEVIKEIQDLFEKTVRLPVARIEKIPQSGSDRIYFRIHGHDATFIATYGRNTRENDTFIYFSRHFRSCGCPVPEILAVNSTNTIYIQEDFGDVSLLNKLDELGFSEEVYGLFQLALKQLAHLQIKGDKNLDYNKCITSKEFGRQAIISDLLYFKYYFLDTLQIPYDKEKLLAEFDELASFLTDTDHKYFMFRDFQSRNIMVREGQVHYIDFQGGMKGALQYDVASMLWQARAELPEEWKNSLLNYYIDCAEEKLPAPIDRERFVSQYNGYVLIRLLQVLGAYGFRGLFERKAHFLTSIPLALNNLKAFLNGFEMTVEFDAKNSWVKKGKETEELLKHEQGHFDVGVLYMQEVLESMATARFTRAGYKDEFQKIIKDIHDKYVAMGDKYDKDTNHSIKKDEQAKWNAFFEEKVLSKE